MPIDDTILNDLLEMEIVQKMEEKMPLTLVAEKEFSLKFACVGVGQAGSRIAEVFSHLGYFSVAINTANQDLLHIDIPERKKLLINLGSLSGAGKDILRGENAVIQHKDSIVNFLESELVGDSEFIFLAVSGGGGSGAGSVQPMIDILTQFGRPLGVLFILPLNNDDSIAKKNSLMTLAKLAKLSKTNVISSLIIVDNSKIETIYGDLSQAQFWKVANKAIVAPIHAFNTLTQKASEFTALDGSDFGKILTTGDISIIGSFRVDEYENETSLAEAVVKSFSSNMLSAGFDLSQTRCGGVIIVGKKQALDKISSNAINYMYHVIAEKTNSSTMYRGMYVDDNAIDDVRIFSWLSGIGLPVDRINSLKAESLIQVAKAEEKEKSRVNVMNLDLGEQTTTSVQEIHKKIEQKNSGFNRLAGGIVDRRKK